MTLFLHAVQDALDGGAAPGPAGQLVCGANAVLRATGDVITLHDECGLGVLAFTLGSRGRSMKPVTRETRLCRTSNEADRSLTAAAPGQRAAAPCSERQVARDGSHMAHLANDLGVHACLRSCWRPGKASRAKVVRNPAA